MTLLIALWLNLQASSSASSRVLGCHGPFTADLTEARLVEIFGAANVRTGDVYVGEGFSEPGAVVFPDSAEDRVEVVWGDGATRSRPRFVRVNNERSRWKLAGGIAIATDLKTIERLNGRPFRLLGFSWDYSGTVMSWAGGFLEREGTPTCRTGARLRPSAEQRDPIIRQVIGERRFSSGHPAMQQLNPRVYDLWLSFDRPRRQD